MEKATDATDATDARGAREAREARGECVHRMVRWMVPQEADPFE